MQTADYQVAIQSCALFDQSDASKIALRGPDARSFLHNLCTQDVKNLPVGAGCEAFLTTNKARVIAHVWVGHYQTDSGGVLWLDAVAGQADRILQHLNHFLISEQVELADRTQELGMLRLAGPRAAECLAKITGTPLAEVKPLHHIHVAGVGFIRRQNLLALDGYDLFCPASETAALHQRLLDTGAVAATAATYEILRVEAGLPEYGRDIDENRLAMETGRIAQAISYTKGCYLGQETIVMARDRGQANRLLTGVKLAEGAPPAPGAKLFRGKDEVGEVTSSVHSPRLSQVIALAYLRRGSWDAGTELLVADGRAATVRGLPFYP